MVDLLGQGWTALCYEFSVSALSTVDVKGADHGPRFSCPFPFGRSGIASLGKRGGSQTCPAVLCCGSALYRRTLLGFADSLVPLGSLAQLPGCPPPQESLFNLVKLNTVVCDVCRRRGGL